MKGKIGGFKFETDEKGNFIYKASNSKVLNKKGELKPKYKDLPRIKMIYKIEESWTKEFKKAIEEGLKEGLKKLK